MDINLISAIIFYLLVISLIIVFRKKFIIQAKIIALYKTKIGLKLIDKIAFTFPFLLKNLAYLGILIGYVGMILISYLLVKGAYILLTVPSSPSMIAPVIPGIKIPGSPLFVPFWYGIISIFIVVLVHEAAHGIVARIHKMRIKSSGVGMFAIFPIAFVEPDEKQLKKSKKKHQLSVFAAGPFSNIILAALVAVISIFLLIPFALSLTDTAGVELKQLQPGFPAETAGIKPGEIILSINNQSTTTVENFTAILKNTSVNQTITINTQNNTYVFNTAANPDNESQSYIGVYVSQHLSLKQSIKQKYGNTFPWSIFYVVQLFQWIFILSLGIGLANLLPLGPVDGGRILLTTLSHFFEKQKAEKLWKKISLLTLILLVFNFIYPYIRNLF
ncbi:site-2 protease family protein [Candidatus Woesearchaeota archaeon]|nr:site-2 protease family protein [Candidatus Woesearchaeota archaeon]